MQKTEILSNLNPTENIQFKILYVFGMIFVVAGHCGGGGVSLFYDWFTPYSFHMPLFIFISGYFFKDKNIESLYAVIRYIAQKFMHLMIPMYLWNFAYGIFSEVLYKFGFHFGRGLTFNNLVIFPLNNGHQFTLNLCSWFIAPLFFAETINVIIRFVFNKILYSLKNKILIINISVFMIFIILGSVDFYLCMNNPECLSLFTKRLLFFLAFYNCGILYKNCLEKYDVLNNFFYFILIFLCQLFVITIRKGQPTYGPAWMNDFKISSDIFMPYLCAFLGIGFWLRVSKNLVPILKNSKIIRVVFENGFSILMHQFLGFMFLKGIFAVISKYTRFCGNFNISEFKNNIWYYYYPRGRGQWAMLYCLIAIALSVIIGMVERLIVKSIKNNILELCIKCKIKKTREVATVPLATSASDSSP